MELEPMPMPVDRLSFGMLEPMDPELLYLLVSTKDDSSNTMIKSDFVKEEVLSDDDMMPLNLVVSTPTGVEAYNPDFSNVEMQDLMSLLLPERSAVATDAASTRAVRALQPKKLVKRTKKCTYAARRREVASLRSEVETLEATLNAMRSTTSGGSDWLQQAAAEKAALDAAQAENERLRGAVSAREAKIRKFDAFLCNLQR